MRIPPAAIIYITSADNDLLLHESQITALKHLDVKSMLIRCCTLAGFIPSFSTTQHSQQNAAIEKLPCLVASFHRLDVWKCHRNESMVSMEMFNKNIWCNYLSSFTVQGHSMKYPAVDLSCPNLLDMLSICSPKICL